MLLIPAIDIKQGRCVRLRQGRMEDETVYYDSPREVALMWKEKGAELVHVVDLDGAVRGEPVSYPLIKEIAETVDVPLQVGGGIRTVDAAEAYLSLPRVRRIVLGTVATEKPELVEELSRRYPDRIAVGIDVKDGRVAIKGWVEVATLKPYKLAKRFKEKGIEWFIYTEISRDGMLMGPDFDGIRRFVAEVGSGVIASGGVTTIEDIEELKKCGVAGAIVGRALYDGTIELEEAIKRLAG